MLHLLHQERARHQHLGRPDLAEQAEDHLQGRQWFMALEPAKGNRRSMWEKWATQDPVDKDALSTERCRKSNSSSCVRKKTFFGPFFLKKKSSCYSHFHMLSVSVYLSRCTLESLIASGYLSSPEDGQKTRLSESDSVDVISSKYRSLNYFGKVILSTLR